MRESKLTVINATGLHARPANVFVQAAQQYDCDISVKKGENSVDAKSILGILTLGAGKGSEIVITAQGKDENEAIETLTELIETGFDE